MEGKVFDPSVWLFALLSGNRKPTLGLQLFTIAASAFNGIELVNMIRKGKFTPGVSVCQ